MASGRLSLQTVMFPYCSELLSTSEQWGNYCCSQHLMCPI